MGEYFLGANARDTVARYLSAAYAAGAREITGRRRQDMSTPRRVVPQWRQTKR